MNGGENTIEEKARQGRVDSEKEDRNEDHGMRCNHDDVLRVYECIHLMALCLGSP